MPSAQVTITQLPQAGAITGTEAVPIVQNGQTVQTTTAAIAASPSQTQTFLTLNQESTLPNSRALSVGSGLGLTDGGAQSTLQVNLAGAVASLFSSTQGLQAKTGAGTMVGRTITGGTGVSVTNGNGDSGNPTIGLNGTVGSLAGLAGTGILGIVGGSSVTSVEIQGTANEIDVANGTGPGNPTIGIADNPTIPGVEGMVVPAGTTGERPAGTLGQVRYNTSTSKFEGYRGSWSTFGTGDGTVTSVNASGGTTGLSFTGGPITTSGTLTLTGTPTKATNIAGGAAYQVPYQTATDTTGFVAAPTVSDTFLKWNGSSFEWGAVAGAGTVTSVDASGGTTGLTFSGGPITAAGTLTLSGTLAVANGGTGATDAGTARTNLSAAASGANSDITSMSGITGAIATPTYIDFNTTQNPLPTDATARFYYNNEDQFQTFAFQMNGNVVQKIGEEQYFRVKCSSAVTKGQVVMFTGTLGASGSLTAAPATGLTADQSNYILGIATESGNTNDWIFVTFFGEVKGIDTTGGVEAWANGTVLYYNPSVTGGLTDTKPNTPNAIAVMAAVVYAHATNGILFVRPTYGSVLGGTDGNVQFGTLNNGDVIVYDSTDQRWENVAQSTLTAGSATNIAGGTTNQVPYQTGAGATSFIAAPTIGGTYLEWSGSAFQWSTVTAGVSSVTASAPLASSGGSTPDISLTGTIQTTNGGLGVNSFTAGDLVYYATGTAFSKLGIGTSTYLLTSSGTAPQWSDPSGVTVGTATNATNATNVAVTATTTNATFYPAFVDATTGNQGIEVGTGLTFNPSTNTLTTTTFSGALNGNASTATDATNAANVAVAATTTNATFYPAFVDATTGNQAVEVDTDLTYNPSTNTLTAGTMVATTGIFGGTF